MFDANHRSAILNKATGGFSDDFDSMLGDLSSVIKDLESFTVVRRTAPAGIVFLSVMCVCVCCREGGLK